MALSHASATPVDSAYHTTQRTLAQLPGTSQAKYNTKGFVWSPGEVETGSSLDSWPVFLPNEQAPC